MTDGFDATAFDLSRAKALAFEAAAHWGLTLEAPFSMSNVSYVAPAGPVVVKVPWGGDDESLTKPTRCVCGTATARFGCSISSAPAILEERAVPGDDLSAVPDAEATRIALDIGQRIWVAGRAAVSARSFLRSADGWTKRRWLELSSYR